MSDVLSPDALKVNIARAEERKRRALQEYEKAKAELEWWKQGQRLFGSTARADGTSTSAEAVLHAPGTVPSLRQAIVTVMRDEGRARWRVRDLAAALDRRGWLPETHAAQKRVSDMASIMAADGQIHRLARGVYTLAPELDIARE